MILAFGAFKGVASSSRVGFALEAMLRTTHPHQSLLVRPLADGGEGTLQVFQHYLGGVVRPETVVGPMGGAITADVLWLNHCTAVLESSQAVGYGLVRADQRDPWRASTFGVGELIRHVALSGATTLYVTMGDSIVMDMGLGALCALGAKLVDSHGALVELTSLRDALQIEEVVLPEVHRGLCVRVLSDTRDFLVGKHGQVAVYGRQKGLKIADQAAMEATAEHVTEVFTRAFGRNVGQAPFSSGSGGLAAALHGLFDAPMHHCVQWLFARTSLRDDIQRATTVVTGEGSLDAQTRWGKVPWMVATLQPARLIVVAGSSTEAGRRDIRAACPESEVNFVDVPIADLDLDSWLRCVHRAIQGLI